MAAVLVLTAACMVASSALGSIGSPAATLPAAPNAAAWGAPHGGSQLIPSARSRGISFGGIPAVGVLAPGRSAPAAHFCTASVVHSPRKDLIITAAHCVARYVGSPSGLTFVPNYAQGAAPYGFWRVTQIFVSAAWTSSADPDADVAFLTVRPAAGSAAIEELTGAERLEFGRSAAAVVHVIGYPNGQDLPIVCQNRVSVFAAHQMRFDCGSFTTGTSGGPFLADIDARTGEGTVIGVIGGYQGGGTTAGTSYSVTFDRDAQTLYDAALRAG